MSAATLAATDAGAAFRYIPPPGPRPSFAAAEHGDPAALGPVLRRLVPKPLTVRFDRRVDTGRRIPRDYGNWESLLHGEGLEHARHGDEIHVRPAGLDPADTELVSGRGGRADWRIEAGETLADILARWGARAGVEILFLTDRRYRVHRSRAFHGSFAEAVRALFFGLSHLPEPPAGELSPDGASLAVTHRPGRGGEGR